jgi:hypothetical protein
MHYIQPRIIRPNAAFPFSSLPSMGVRHESEA